MFCMLILLLPHDLCATVELRGSTLHIEAWFDNETPADGASVKLKLHDAVVNETTTDERGLGSLPVPTQPGQYVIVVDDGGGHRTEVQYRVDEEAGDQTAGDSREEVRQRRWRGALIGLGVILTLTAAGRVYFQRRKQ